MTAIPARSAIPVHAYGIAATLRPREVAEHLGAGVVKVTKTYALARHEDDRYTVAYDFGAIVFFNVPQDERERAVARIVQHAGERYGPEPHPPIVDDYLVELRPGAAPELTFDRAVVPELSVPFVELASLVLAQSVAMDYYEEDIEGLYRRVEKMSTQLAERGRLGGREGVLNRFVGSILVTRNQIVMTLSLLDAPAITWERETYDRVYRELRRVFEIEDRYTAIEHKLGLIQDNLEIIVDLTQHRRAWLLEVTVVCLIAFEIVMGFLR